VCSAVLAAAAAGAFRPSWFAVYAAVTTADEIARWQRQVLWGWTDRRAAAHRGSRARSHVRVRPIYPPRRSGFTFGVTGPTWGLQNRVVRRHQLLERQDFHRGVSALLLRAFGRQVLDRVSRGDGAPPGRAFSASGRERASRALYLSSSTVASLLFLAIGGGRATNIGIRQLLAGYYPFLALPRRGGRLFDVAGPSAGDAAFPPPPVSPVLLPVFVAGNRNCPDPSARALLISTRVRRRPGNGGRLLLTDSNVDLGPRPAPARPGGSSGGATHEIPRSSISEGGRRRFPDRRFPIFSRR
jgi:hypothetical protein